jgi:hypothetical protein
MGGPGSGGSRVRSGPPRDPNAIRRGRDGRSGLVQLPAAGREGEPPAWPFPRPTKFELETWAREWARPQAVMWERLGWEVQVALYVRNLRQASSGKGSATTTTNLLRQMDMLGLSDDGMRRKGWEVADGAPVTAAPRRAPTSTAKDRLKVLSGGADARAS